MVDRTPQYAPSLGGKLAVLAELDRADRTATLSQAIKKVLACPYNLVPDLLQRLEAEDVRTAQKAAIALGYLGSPQAVMPLVAVVRAGKTHLYWQATMALSRIGGAEVVDYLVEFLGSESVVLQSASAKALGRCGLAGLQPLVDCLRCPSTDVQVRFQAIHALGEIGSPVAVSALLPELRHPSRHIRSQAGWALGRIRSPLASGALAACLTDPDISVQASAVQALKAIGTAALPPLLSMLKHPASHTRSTALRTLAQMGLEEVVEDIAEVLFNDPFPYVRCDAAQALGEIGSPLAVHYLGQAVKASDRSVRTAVIRALRKLKSPPAIQILRRIDPQWAEQETTILQHLAQFRIREEDYTVIQEG
ncbi:MAG: HEAT repeat domain-containing protein [Pseudanabaenaceae cyanobacterium]